MPDLDAEFDVDANVDSTVVYAPGICCFIVVCWRGCTSDLIERRATASQERGRRGLRSSAQAPSFLCGARMEGELRKWRNEKETMKTEFAE